MPRKSDSTTDGKPKAEGAKKPVGKPKASRAGSKPKASGSRKTVKKPQASVAPKTGGEPNAGNEVFQFKVTLAGSEPAIWRRIQVPGGTLHQLHDHLQLAMGWTNSHLHQFWIGEDRLGDPKLLGGGWDDDDIKDSKKLTLDALLPKDGEFCFVYEYDFGDGWEHVVEFEGHFPRLPGEKYPRCLEGERACPPEDIGGIGGYEDYLEAIADPEHEQHEEMIEWNGPFDPEAFDVRKTTAKMLKGLPRWGR
jgi:hypothetical protein